ncbi:non-canonical purine NTP diphosphatase [Saccharicrinis sp. FJH54]|uniref:non-canonical purine NTP diphosphatase n=1 Tax=Saccharicrinis sp. FJH54 TaxID=3344665 RepID=UPI0035D4718C
MHKIVFATNNQHKLTEVKALLGDKFDLVGLDDIGCTEEIPETADTLEGNALIKARYVADRYGLDCFADDTGLEVPALNNAPGVYSARYAGPQKSADDNVAKLLRELNGLHNRKAHFRTVIALIIEGKEHLFEGVVDGYITKERHGSEGFGYDPVFLPDGKDKTFAEMLLTEKNTISHRARAVSKLVNFLNKLQ